MHMREIKSYLNVSIGILGDLLQIPDESRATEAVREILRQLLALRTNVADVGEMLTNRWHPLVADTSFKQSALNLAHYLALRRYDLRPLQQALVPLGVSSLGRCEAHVLPTLDAVLATLADIVGENIKSIPKRPPRRSFEAASENLSRHAAAVLGPISGPRCVRIMVTLPTEAATERSWARKVISAGTDCVRINCGHDDVEVWQKMISNVRAAARARGRRYPILMDLSGPRARAEEVLIPEELKPHSLGRAGAPYTQRIRGPAAIPFSGPVLARCGVLGFKARRRRFVQ